MSVSSISSENIAAAATAAAAFADGEDDEALAAPDAPPDAAEAGALPVPEKKPEKRGEVIKIKLKMLIRSRFNSFLPRLVLPGGLYLL